MSKARERYFWKMRDPIIRYDPSQGLFGKYLKIPPRQASAVPFWKASRVAMEGRFLTSRRDERKWWVDIAVYIRIYIHIHVYVYIYIYIYRF